MIELIINIFSPILLYIPENRLGLKGFLFCRTCIIINYKLHVAMYKKKL